MFKKKIGNKAEGETSALISIAFFMGFLAFMMLLVPEPLQFVTGMDLAGLGVGMGVMSVACVVATGIPCAVAITGWSIYNFFTYFVVSGDYLKFLFFFPLSLILLYIFMRLAKGGG